MNAKPVPLHCHVPAKYWRSLRCWLGLGASAAAAREAKRPRARMVRKIRDFIQAPSRSFWIALNTVRNRGWMAHPAHAQYLERVHRFRAVVVDTGRLGPYG